MKEDLNIHGNQYNLLTTFFTCGYLVGQIPSQLLLTKCMKLQIEIRDKRLLIIGFSVRPSYYLPIVELLWTIVTFCFAAVQSTKQVFALRFLIGMLESPFAVGVITLMGSWYTPRGMCNDIVFFPFPPKPSSLFFFLQNSQNGSQSFIRQVMQQACSADTFKQVFTKV
jgi:MFS transporter, ACS family, pantothenate transporter